MSNKSIKLGAVCYEEYPYGYLEFLDLAKSLKLSWVEFKFEKPLAFRSSSRQYGRIRNLAESYGIGLSMHTSFVGLNIASLDSEEREASILGVEESICAAAEMGINLATIHAGSLPLQDYSESNWEDSKLFNIESINRLLSYARGKDVNLCLENGNAFKKSQLKHGLHPGSLREIADSVDGDLYYTVDFGHGLYLSRDPSYLVSELGIDRVKLSHLHSNSGLEDSHSSLKSGILSLEAILNRSVVEGWDIPLSIEMKNENDLRESIECVYELINTVRH
ncbi:MAG TPA: hypothetical protein DCO79_07335 [Spirochaeta sp.]|nr:hypothetical protein [Spirochaeta sp.]